MLQKLKQKMPTQEQMKNSKSLSWLGNHLFSPTLWSFHRRNVMRAVYVGIFWGWIAVPFQMPAAALFAILFRANAPLSLALVWFSNPLTWVPIFYLAYYVGTLVLGIEPTSLQFEASAEWLTNVIADIWLPLYVGGAVMGLITGGLAFLIGHWIWRWRIQQRWKRHLEKRHKRH